MEYYDADGFELEFEDDSTLEERDYYAQQYPNVDLVAKKRNHCTSCGIHLGTAPSAIIKMHKVLRVTQCGSCYRFYNSGVFVKGEDGNDLHCRWCGQGGQLYCCAVCPYVFCEKCIVRNFTVDGLKEVLSNDHWKCYDCAPKILYPLQAQHWALVNFIKKQEKSLQSKISKGLSDQDEITSHMKKDSSICCKSKITTKRFLQISTDEEDVVWSEDVDKGNTSRSSRRIKKQVKTRPKGLRQSLTKITKFASPTSVNRRNSRKRVEDETTLKDLRRERRIHKPHGHFMTVKRNEVRPSLAMKTIPTTIVTDVKVEEIDCKPDIFPYVPIHSPEMNGDQLDTSIHDDEEMYSVTDAMEPVTQTNTEVERGRTQFQSRMSNAMETCRQVDGKLTDLMNSTTYKTANSMNDIKELYTCLSFLFTFANDQVQSLQEKCMDDMRQFGFENDEAESDDGSQHFLDENLIEIGEFSLKNEPDESEIKTEFVIENQPVDDENEIEIIEPTHTTIILDDSD